MERPLWVNGSVVAGGPEIRTEELDATLVGLVNDVGRTDADHAPSSADALARLAEAEDTLRAIAAGEVDAFVVSEGGPDRRVFTLATADRPYRMFVENMRDGAATISSSGLILYANRRVAELLGHPRESVVGSMLSNYTVDGAELGPDVLLGPRGLGTTFELDLVDRDGGTVSLRVGSAPLDVDGDHLTCLTLTDLRAQRAQDREIARLSAAQDERVADLQDVQAELTKQATHDALTGLPNRALLVDRIDQALAQSSRSGRCLAVLFVDLDRFKQVNDTQGHAAGDLVLNRVAKQLVAVLRPMDTVARIGGDEFVILAPDVASHLHAVDIANRLVVEVCRRPTSKEEGERITASIGLSVSVDGRGSAEILLNEADMAMYEAKSLGGARAEAFDAALGVQAQERSMAQQRLQSALDDRRIAVHYQPIIDLGSGDAGGTVAGFEALARITDLDGSILPPASFIPVAEDTGLVVPLGSHVLAIACEEARAWQPGRRFTVAVNLSSRQFQPGDLPQIVRAELARTALPPECLHLELTETAIIELRPDILQQLREIRELGVEIGLDDFGTGYASLTHLRRLPLSFVKIDQSFVQGLGVDDQDDRIVAAVVDLAANLGLRSVAEGVECTEQLERLRALGCDQAQGYLFDRPMAAADVPSAMLRRAW